MADAIDPLDEERKAIDLIARSPEGRLLHRYLRRILETVHDLPDVGTLQSANGRRTLARDLMSLMARGISDTTRTDAGSRTSDDAILAASGRASSVRRRAGARRVEREPDDGWGPVGSGDTDAGDAGTVIPIGSGARK